MFFVKDSGRGVHTEGMAPIRFVLVLVLWSSTATACGNDTALGPDAGLDTSDGSSSAHDGAVDAGAEGDAATEGDVQIVWGACDTGTDPSIECGIASLPWDHAEGQGPRMELRMRRSVHPGAHGQIWGITGGPGGSIVTEFESWVPDLRATAPDLDIYAIDHRGVGGDTRLTCPVQETPDSPDGTSIGGSEWPACIAALQEIWGEHLQLFSTGQSVDDLHSVLNAVREANGGTEQNRVFLWGGSYGTYFVSRFLQTYPDAVDGVIVEGIDAPSTSFAVYDSEYNGVGHDFMNRCAEDSACASHFDGDPWDVLNDALTAVDHGHCAALGADRTFFASFFADLLMQVGLRDLIPALVARLRRCNDDDVAVWSHAYYALYPTPDPSVEPAQQDLSYPLFMNVAVSEMWTDPAPTLAEVLATEASLAMSTGLGPRIAAVVPIWPRYTVGPAAHATPNTTTPILFLQGQLDPATPHAQAQEYAAAFNAPGQHFVSFANGSHVIVSGTPHEGGDCGRSIVSQFVANPLSTLDIACAETAAEIDFSGNNETSAYVLGTSDAWNGGVE